MTVAFGGPTEPLAFHVVEECLTALILGRNYVDIEEEQTGDRESFI